MAEAEKVLGALALPVTVDRALVGGAAYAATGHPLPPETLAKAKAADALLFGAVGDPRFDTVERHLRRSEEHTSELQSLMRISYAVFCLKKKKKTTTM